MAYITLSTMYAVMYGIARLGGVEVLLEFVF
jgi:hypothetical protein